MRYVYYIIIILLIITGAAAWGIFSDAKVEFSKPVIVVNDRIIAENEYDDLIKTRPVYYNENEFIDFLIEKELLIQEAIKRGIAKDEPFRASVEDFYEQSLIKILMDRQYKELNPDVSDNEIAKYIALTGMKVFISKTIYKTKKDIENNKIKNTITIESAFLDLSESLKFTVFNIKTGESSDSFETTEGFVLYNLIKTEPIIEQIIDPGNDQENNRSRIKEFIKNGKKEALLAQWVNGLKEKANIWRRK